MRAALFLGPVPEGAEIYALSDAPDRPQCYGLVTRKAAYIDPDTLMLALDPAGDGTFMREILEDVRVSLHPVAGHAPIDLQARHLCDLLGLSLLAECPDNSGADKIELLVSPATAGSEYQVARIADRLGQQDTDGNIVSLFVRRNANIPPT